MSAAEIVFKNGTVVNHDGTAPRDIGVSGGKVVGFGSYSQAGEVIDCTGLHILPGVIDSQVHFREPGAEHKEDLLTGSRAAVAGGVTGVFEMPNTKPTTTTAEALADKIRRASGRMHCNFAFYAGATQDPRVRALVLMAPHVLTEQKTVMNIAEAKRSFEATDLREKLARYHGENVDCAFWGWCDAWLDADFRRWDITPWLPAIKLPVLTVRGNDDAYNTAVHVERIVSGVCGPVTRVDLPDCGHAPHLEQGEGVVVAASSFVLRVGATK